MGHKKPGEHPNSIQATADAATRARIAKARREFEEERRLMERYHAHGDTSGGTTDPGLPGYDEEETDGN